MVTPSITATPILLSLTATVELHKQSTTDSSVIRLLSISMAIIPLALILPKKKLPLPTTKLLIWQRQPVFIRILKKTILQSYPLENMQKFIRILKSLQNISIIFLHFLLFLIDVIYQSLAIDNLLHKWWECLTLETLSSGLVGNDTGIKIHLYLISCFDF